MFKAKNKRMTPSGSWYSIGQDAPESFHVSVGKGNFVIYEHFLSPPSIEFITDNILLLEKQLEQPS